MTSPKIILIGKIGALIGAIVIVGGVAMYLNQDNDTLPEQSVLEQSLLKDYKKLSEKAEVPESDLLSSCAKPYVDKIFKLTVDLENIKKTRQRYLNNEEFNSIMANPIPVPESLPPDLDGNPTPVNNGTADEEFIPRVGSETPYLDPSDKPVDVLALYDKLIKETEQEIDDEIAKIKSACTDAAEEEKKDCETPCRNYIHKCLSMVPNADQNLFNQGLASCVEECRAWDDAKIQCMINASDCPAMTEICGL